MDKQGNILFPIVLSVLLGSATFYLYRATDVKIVEQKLDTSIPEYQIQGLHADRFDKNGKQIVSIQSPHTWKMPDLPSIYFDKPYLYMLNPLGELYQLRSNKGEFNTDNGIVYFDGNAYFNKLNTQKVETMMLKAPFVQMDTNTEIIDTKGFTQFQFGSSRGEGNNLKINPKTETFVIGKRLSTVINPDDFKHPIK